MRSAEHGTSGRPGGEHAPEAQQHPEHDGETATTDAPLGVLPSAVEEGAAVNQVTLRGRVSTVPQSRDLPSGTSIVTLRVSVPRSPSPMTKGSKQASDWVDCAAWGSRQRRRVSGWRLGDLVEVEGALRRRIYRGGSGTAMRLEVEVLGGRLIARALRRPPPS